MEKFALGISIGAAVSGAFLASVNTSEKKIKALTDKADQLGKQKIAVDNVKKYRMALSDLTSASGLTGAASAKTKKQIRETRNALKAAKVEAKGMGVNVRKLTHEEKKFDAAIRLTNKSLMHRTTLSANKKDRRKMRGDLVDAAVPVAAMVVPIKMAVDFESVMADVKKVVDLPTPVAVKAMEQDILSLSTKIPMAADGIASIVASAGQAGIAKTQEELVGFAKTAATMGVAFDMGGAESGKMMADWRSGMQLNQAQAVGLADAVNYLSNNMNAQAQDLGMVIQRQGAVAMSAGLTETQVASLGAALLSGGAGPEIAATALKNLTGAMTKGMAATKAQREAFAALGFDAEQMAVRMQENAPEAINSVFQALKDAPKEEQSALISQLFGEESKGAIAPLLANLDNLNKAFGLTSDKLKYTGSMQKEYEVRSKTTANNLALMRNKATRLGIGLGSVLLPAINTLITPIGIVMDLAAATADKFPVLTTVVVGAAVGTVALTAATVAGAYAFSLVHSGITKLKLAHTVLKGAIVRTTIVQNASILASKGATAGTKALAVAQVGLGMAMKVAFGPVGLIIGAVAVGALLIYKYWKPIKAFFLGLAKGIGAAVSPIKAALAPVLTYISPITNAIGSIMSGVMSWAAEILSPIGNIISGLSGLFSQSEAGVGAAGSLGEKIGSGLVNAVKFTFMNFTPAGWLIKGFSAVKGFLATIDWSASGSAIVGTLVSGIKSMATKPFEAVKGMFTKVRGLMASSDAKEGPLSDLTQSGKATVETIALGMQSAEGVLYNRFKKVAGNGVEALQPSGSDSLPGNTIGSQSRGIHGQMATKPFDAVKGVFGKVRGLMASSDAKEGPLSDLTQIGKATVETLALGMQSAEGVLHTRFKKVAGNGVEALQPSGSDSLPGSTTGSQSGGLHGQGSGRGQVVVHFNPTINVSGHNSSGVRKEMDAALGVSEQRLRQVIIDIIHRDRRLSYA